MDALKNEVDIEQEDEYTNILERIGTPGFLPVKSMNDLYEIKYDGKDAVVENLLYPDLYIIAGSPKLGKSLLMLLISFKVSKGQPLWGYQVTQGTVLYLALEDDYQRLQSRLYRMFGAESSENLYFGIEAKKLGDGLEEQLICFVKDHPDTKLVIIDTLQKIRGATENHYSYGEDYKAIAELKRLADQLGIALILVHHTRKQEASDSFDMISGTRGLLGAADGAMVLYKKNRTDADAILEVTGRDQQDQKLYLTKDPNTLCWELKSVEVEAQEELPNPILESIAKLVTVDTPVWVGSATALADLLVLDIKPNVLSTHLNVNARRLLKQYSIVYERSRSRTCRTITLTHI